MPAMTARRMMPHSEGGGRTGLGEKKLMLWVKINQRSMSNLGSWLRGWRVLGALPWVRGPGDAGHHGGTQQLHGGASSSPTLPKPPSTVPEAAL